MNLFFNMNKSGGLFNIINNILKKNQIPIINQSLEKNSNNICNLISDISNYTNKEISYYYNINNYDSNFSKIIDNIISCNHKHKYIFIKDTNNSTDLYYCRLIENLQNKNISIYKNYSIYLKSSFNQLKNDIKYFDNIGIQIDKSICFNSDIKKSNIFINSKEIMENYHKMVIYILNKSDKNIYINFAVHNKNTEDLAKLYYNNSLNKDLISISYMRGMDNENNICQKTFKFVSYGINADYSPLAF